MASSLAMHAYDTLSIARNLEQDYEFDKKQAEGIARAIHEHLVANVATKDDLGKLSIELNGRIDNLEGKIDNLEGRINNLEGRIDNLEGKIDSLGKALTFRMGAMVTAGIGLLAALQAVTG